MRKKTLISLSLILCFSIVIVIFIADCNSISPYAPTSIAELNKFDALKIVNYQVKKDNIWDKTFEAECLGQAVDSTGEYFSVIYYLPQSNPADSQSGLEGVNDYRMSDISYFYKVYLETGDIILDYIKYNKTSSQHKSD